jgi:hypothetical protein
MKKKRWIVVAAIMLVCIGLAFAVGIAMTPGQQVTDANFDAIEIGMPIKTVESIFGRPADAAVASMYAWSGDERPDGTLMVIINVDGQDRVVSTKKGRRQLHPVDKFMVRLFPSWIL